MLMSLPSAFLQTTDHLSCSGNLPGDVWSRTFVREMYGAGMLETSIVISYSSAFHETSPLCETYSTKSFFFWFQSYQGSGGEPCRWPQCWYGSPGKLALNKAASERVLQGLKSWASTTWPHSFALAVSSARFKRVWACSNTVQQKRNCCFHPFKGHQILWEAKHKPIQASSTRTARWLFPQSLRFKSSQQGHRSWQCAVTQIHLKMW